MADIPADAVGLRLARIDRRENLILCEAVRFERGRSGVEIALRRAGISGCVIVGGDIKNHFADILDNSGDIVETVSLDSRSYSALKNHWMRCKVQSTTMVEDKRA